ncbi:hypothetical protein [Parachlamydia acanthamoebae]|uniref:hypothetical protein n=1 Tax=Parachlamydia acanthamoebae TaxID=83552 RepID=UPI0007508A38|nr:hypothetical protein [Parachlamydia acanthamoebae]
MKKYLFGFFLLITVASLQSDESNDNDNEINFQCNGEVQVVPRRYPCRVYALRRYDSDGEIRYTDTSWAGKREDDFYDSLTR